MAVEPPVASVTVLVAVAVTVTEPPRVTVLVSVMVVGVAGLLGVRVVVTVRVVPGPVEITVLEWG